ncbi:MAG: hypothetical protein MUD08_02585 [Cytophagales bacterium]|jgi:hypothetical protein|nr:hypothetical protein [Cytophagales bacterium]
MKINGLLWTKDKYKGKVFGFSKILFGSAMMNVKLMKLLPVRFRVLAVFRPKRLSVGATLAVALFPIGSVKDCPSLYLTLGRGQAPPLPVSSAIFIENKTDWTFTY